MSHIARDKCSELCYYCNALLYEVGQAAVDLVIRSASFRRERPAGGEEGRDTDLLSMNVPISPTDTSLTPWGPIVCVCVCVCVALSGRKTRTSPYKRKLMYYLLILLMNAKK